jgi:hypothetical protein
LVIVSVKTLADILDPFNARIWGDVVTKEDVEKALDENRLISDSKSKDHAGRIAYFVVNAPREPILIDVGVEDYILEWIIDDGNHRLCGSIFAGREYIAADISDISGNCDLIEILFGKEAVLDG